MYMYMYRMSKSWSIAQRGSSAENHAFWSILRCKDGLMCRC